MAHPLPTSPITGFGYRDSNPEPAPAPAPAPVVQTGYWGHVDADNRERVTKVHLRRPGADRPLCGARVSAKASFQYCANRKVADYLTCDTCQSL